MKYKLIVFDFDGTLADTFEFFLDKLNNMAVKFHFKTLSDEDKKNIKSLSAREIIKFLEIPFWKTPKVAKAMKQNLESSNQKIQTFDQIPETLNSIQKLPIELALLTSNHQKNVQKILGTEYALFGKSIFDVSILGKHRKFKKLIKDYNIPRSEVLLVGDEVRDIEAAQKIGVDIAAVCWGYNAEKILNAKNPTYLIKKPEEILDILN